MLGKIIKGIGGFYYVHTSEHGIYACRARGIFRNENIKPLVGDLAEFEVTHEGDKEGNLVRILPRRNELLRPAVANVDQVLIFFAAAKPAPNFNMLDRYLIRMQMQEVETLLCFNKIDLIKPEAAEELRLIYQDCGSRLLFISAKEQTGVAQLRAALADRTTVLAGPSGAGKSTIMNLLKPDAGMQTGEISRKIERGRHTTRHSELFHLEGHTYLMDTPGFTSISIDSIEAGDLKDYYPEFLPYQDACRFGSDCVHIHEPDCRVKQAVERGGISRQRYENYKVLYEELKNIRKF